LELSQSFKLLVNIIADIDGVLSIGKSGGGELPTQNESDIDIFVFCEKVPSITIRRSEIRNIEKFGVPINSMSFAETRGEFWGVCDFLTIDNYEFCLMFFTITEMDMEIDSVLNGLRLDRVNEYFYPTGRCATFIGMCILCDKTGYIANMKNRLAVYPKSLAEKAFNYHISYINPDEDFARAVVREDILFYHATIEKAIDQYLQALFALNRCFFPSRKRSRQYIESFECKPSDCYERMLKVIELGAKPETIKQSYDTWTALCAELIELSDKYN